MSTLEERREARRRRRQQEEAEAAGFSTINGEDELERRRRERREQRLRSGATETPSEDTSSRRRRRRGTEDELDTGITEETESAPASVPEPEPEPQVNHDAEEEARRRREEEEEAERQRAAEEARRRAQEEEDRRRRQEEEERRQREEEERRRREEEDEDTQSGRTDSDSDMSESESSGQREKDRKVDEQLQRLKALEKNNDLLLDEENWNRTTNGMTPVRRKSDERGKITSPTEPTRRALIEYSLRAGEDGKCGKLKSFFEEKTDGQENGDHIQMSKSLNFNKKTLGHSTSLEDKSAVHEKLKKFEINQQTKDLQQETKRDLAAYHAKVISPGASRLKDIQKKFEDKSNTENSSSRLGRLSVSESHLNEKPGLPKDSKKHILDRWQSAVETKKTPTKTSPWLSKSVSVSYDFDLNTKGDNIERLSSKFDHNRNEKPEKFSRSATLPLHSHKDMDSLKRQWSHNTEESSNKSDVPEEKSTNRHSIPKVTERWLNKTQSSVDSTTMHPTMSISRSRPKSASYAESYKENKSDTCNTLRSDSWRRKSSSKSEEEERLERERLEEEERERQEAERIMEEQQKKKKGKRKGLGGLSPEKKKMLKKLIMQKAAEDLRNEAKAKAEEKERYINERVGPLKLEGKAEGDLVKLCKELHSQLSKLEEEVYDWEVKIRKQDTEIIQLTLKVNDSKGKFAKPVLKKVNKTESKLNKIAKKDKADFRDNLKSSGQSKFSVEEGEAE